MTFGEWIRDQRGQRKAVDCAERAWPGKTGAKQMWSDLENDRTRRKEGLPTRPNLETLEAIARGLEIPVARVIEAAREHIRDTTRLPVGLLVNPDGTSVAVEDDNSTRTPTKEEIKEAMSVFQRMLESLEKAEKQAEIRGSSEQEIDNH